MEYSQTFYKVWIFCLTFCLNPYSNGILTDNAGSVDLRSYVCLNPYSNGILTDGILPDEVWEKFAS